jgi:hypothetical protein
LIANDDTPVGNHSDTTSNILANDTLDKCINPTIGTNPGQVTLTGVTVPADCIECKGTITVNAEHSIRHRTRNSEVGATPAPTGNCDTASVVVNNPLIANDDTPVAVTTVSTRHQIY